MARYSGSSENSPFWCETCLQTRSSVCHGDMPIPSPSHLVPHIRDLEICSEGGGKGRYPQSIGEDYDAGILFSPNDELDHSVAFHDHYEQSLQEGCDWAGHVYTPGDGENNFVRPPLLPQHPSLVEGGSNHQPNFGVTRECHVELITESQPTFSFQSAELISDYDWVGQHPAARSPLTQTVSPYLRLPEPVRPRSQSTGDLYLYTEDNITRVQRVPGYCSLPYTQTQDSELRGKHSSSLQRSKQSVSRSVSPGTTLLENRCDFPGCERLLKDKAGKKKHMKTHDPEPVKANCCTIGKCGYASRWPKDLVRHMKKHGNERSFRCPHAGCQAFKRQDHLKRHLRSQHGVNTSSGGWETRSN